MATAVWISVWLLCSVLLVQCRGEDCPYKECSCGMTVIMCNELGLVAMPQLMIKTNTYFQEAQYQINNITVVTSGTIPANLSQISFIRNPITTIEDSAFDGSANTLTVLSFYEARFIRIPDAFGHLNNLQSLEIQESPIQDWNVDVMKHIGKSLNSISFVNIPMGTLPSWFQYFTNLTELSVPGCSLADIPDGALDNLANVLIDLSLNNNSLTIVPKAVSSLVALKYLGLRDNKITDIKWLPQSSKLMSLSLDYNKLFNSTQLTNLLRNYADTLSGFSLRGNALSSFPGIDYLTQVTELDLRNNKLADPNSGSLPPGLTDLKLDHNSLQRVPRILSNSKLITQIYLASNAISQLEGTAFPTSAKGVELQNNLLTQITDTSFPVNANITYIILNSNPIVKISDNAFRNLPSLVEVQLKYTKLTRLPLALQVLSKISSFDISHTDTLVCTCLEKSLKDWLWSLPEYNVIGDCGKTSVYYFYHFLSTDCP